jgi:2-dehydropantoate 2-reductase
MIWVAGIGGVGGWLAYGLARAGEPVSLVVRPGQAGPMAASGLRLVTEAGPQPALRLPVAEDLGELPPPSLVVVAVKLPDLEAALSRLEPHLPGGCPVLLFQNGLAAGEIARRALPGRRILHAPVFVNARISGAGEVTVLPPGRVVLPRDPAVVAPFARAGFRVEEVDDLALALWKKAAFLVSFSALNVVLGAPAGAVVADPRFEPLIREIAALAAAEGHPLPVGAVEEIAAFTRRFSHGATSSLYRDRAAGREGEWDDLVGWCQRRALTLGLTLPVLASLSPPPPGG